MYKLKFKDLGRGKFTGDIRVKRLTYNRLAKAVKPYLMSESDFAISEDEKHGVVYAGWHSWDFEIERIGD